MLVNKLDITAVAPHVVTEDTSVLLLIQTRKDERSSNMDKKAQRKMSLIDIVTRPSYKCPTCNYRCSATRVKYGKHQI